MIFSYEETTLKQEAASPKRNQKINILSRNQHT